MSTVIQAAIPEPETTGRLRGFIERIVTNKDGSPRGFGFVRAEDRTEYFIHVRNVRPREAFKTGTSISFRTKPSLNPKDRPSAIDIEVEG